MRFHRTLLDEHFRVEARRTWFKTTDEIQVPMPKFLVTYNRKPPNQGPRMNKRTPCRALRDSLPDAAKTTKMTEQKDRKQIELPFARLTAQGRWCKVTTIIVKTIYIHT